MFIRTENFGQFIRLYPVISVIIAIQCILFILMNLPLLPTNWIQSLFAGVNILIIQGEYWRLITPIFLHAGFLHLIFNSFSLIIFGPALERALGRFTFTLVYFLCGIGANVATLIIEPPFYVHVGASGAIFGLLGIYLAAILFKREIMPAQGKQIILPIVIIGIVLTFFQPNINVTAHIFGLIVGLLIGHFLIKYRSLHFYG